MAIEEAHRESAIAMQREESAYQKQLAKRIAEAAGWTWEDKVCDAEVFLHVKRHTRFIVCLSGACPLRGNSYYHGVLDFCDNRSDAMSLFNAKLSDEEIELKLAILGY